MAIYTIRVVLHDATWQHYVDLAKRLAAKGVVDIIVSDDGRRWRMPPAEYTYTGNEDIAAVTDAVATIAGQVVARNAVFVTAAGARQWRGLEQVT